MVREIYVRDLAYIQMCGSPRCAAWAAWVFGEEPSPGLLSTYIPACPPCRSGTFFYYSAPDMPTSALLGHVRERKAKKFIVPHARLLGSPLGMCVPIPHRVRKGPLERDLFILKQQPCCTRSPSGSELQKCASSKCSRNAFKFDNSLKNWKSTTSSTPCQQMSQAH